MNTEIASLERVRLAAESLRKRSIKPTAERVIEFIGGGSKSTVLGHLRTLRASPAEIDELPPMVTAAFRLAATEVYRAGRDAEADKIRATSERLSQAMEEQDAQISELEQRNTDLETEVARMGENRDILAAEVEKLGSRLAAAEADAAATRRELQAERERADVKSSDALARIERLLAKAEKAAQASGHRQRLSLPSDRNGV